MYLIEVIPFARLPRTLPESFSYFNPDFISEGTIVEIEISRRRLLGLVVRQTLVKDVKQNLRSASFALKKIRGVVNRGPVLNAIDFAFLHWFTNFYLTTPGALLHLMFPAFLPNKSLSDLKPRAKVETGTKKDILIISGDPRIQEYKKAAVSALAEKTQVLILAPEIRRAEMIFQELNSELPKKSVIFVSSTQSPKELRSVWLRIRGGEILLIVATRTALFFPFTKLGLVIVDDDGSPNLKSWDQEPRYHTREVALALAKLYGAKLILGGDPPSLSSYALSKDTEHVTVVIISGPKTSPLSIFVDMQKEIKEAGEFIVFSQVLKDKLRTIRESGGKAFLFVNRKGFAPFILCQECGYVFRCTNCAVPLVYHIQESLAEATLLCHHCSAKNKAPDICLACGSFKLKPYGIGIERVIKDLKKLFPAIPIIPLTAEESNRQNRIKNLEEKLIKVQSYIAVGTEFALTSLVLPPADLTAIISVDTALSLPDFQQGERLFRILFLTRRLGIKHFILQSYAKEPELLKDLFHGNFAYFAEKELKERRKFDYPPYSVLIKLTVRDEKRELALKKVKSLYGDLKLATHQLGSETIEISNPYPAYVEKKKGNFIFHILIKIIDLEKSKEVKSELRGIIPPDVSIDVNPNTLL